MVNKINSQCHDNQNSISDIVHSLASRDVATSHESNFALKGIGTMARESSGRFGSLPLFDDYGSGEDQ